MRRMIIRRDIGDLVLPKSNAFVGDDLRSFRVGPPGPVAIGEEAFREHLVEARFGHPELHHHIVDAAFFACLHEIAAAVEDLGAQIEGGRSLFGKLWGRGGGC